MNKFVKNISWILFPLLLSACGGGDSSNGGGDGGGDGTGKDNLSTPIAGISSKLQLNAFTMPLTVQANSKTAINFNVTAEAEGLVSYQFEDIFNDFHFKPNSGVISLKNKTGQVVTQYLAPQLSGTYHYTLLLKDSHGLTTPHAFAVQVN